MPRSRLFHEFVDTKPVGEEFGPFAESEIVHAEPDAVGAALEDMHLGDHAGFTEGEEIHDAVFGRNRGVAIGLKNESGRRLGSDGVLARKTFGESGVRVVTEKVLLRALVGPRLDERDDWI